MTATDTRALHVSSLHVRAAELRAERVPFVHARVVLAERPTSAKPGDEALVLPDGSIEGFVGGQCAEATVRSHGLALLAGGEPYLLRITPEPEPDQTGKQVVHNPCLSGGTLEIFLEPVMPEPVMAVLGGTPIAIALIEVGQVLGWQMVMVGDADLGSVDALVVASHGHDEQATLTAALAAHVPYIGLVASPKRGRAVVDTLPLAAQSRAKIRTPAGLDLGARTPAEIAMSVFAELVQRRPRRTGGPSPAVDAAAGTHEPCGLLTVLAATTAIDPVCGMSVAAVDASLHAELDGTRYYFCCPGCRTSFVADPAKFLHA